MTQPLQTGFLASQYELEVKIETLAFDAKKELGLPATMDSIFQAMQKMRDNSPLYVSTIQIHGTGFALIYDHAPSYGCYSYEGQTNKEVRPYLGIEYVKTIALEEYANLLSEFNANDDGYSEPDPGSFCPESIVLVDQFNQSIAEYRDGDWIRSKDLPARDQWDDLMQESQKLYSEAALESGWDNFSTAESLRRSASSIERRVQMAKRLSRVIQ